MKTRGDVEAPRLSVLDSDVSFLLARASAVSTAAGNAALERFGLKVRSYAVLAVAAESAPTQRELAARLRLDPSQIVALVDQLEERELVGRRAAPGDRRTRIIEATPAGESVLGEASRALAVTERSAHAALTEHERGVLRALLLRIAYADVD